MSSCAFFGHRHMNVELYEDKLLQILTDLIENKGVTEFYSGYRGDFDYYCSQLVYELKDRYPQIKNTLLRHAFLHGNCDGNCCADHRIVALQR